MDPPDTFDDAPPVFLRINSLHNRPVHNLAGSPGRICLITGTGFLSAELAVTADSDPNIQFSTVSPRELVVVSNVSCGAEHVVVSAVSNESGAQQFLFAAGNNSMGQLGCGRPLAESQRFERLKVSPTISWAQLCCGSFFTLALTNMSDVWAFGQNNHGQLGIDSRQDVIDLPIFCGTLRGVPVCQLAAGSSHSLALSSTGLVFAAGSNSQGQLGLSKRADHRSFTLVTSLAPVYIVQLSAFGSYSAAIDECGALYLWGNKFGPDPQARTIEGHDRFVDVAVGADGRVAVLTDSARLFVVGLYNGGDQLPPTEFQSLVLPFVRVVSGGEYFLVFADQFGKAPLTGLTFSAGRSIRSSDAGVTVQRLRPAARTMAASGEMLQACLIADPNQAIPAFQRLFSSLSSLNGCFLVDNFSESLSDTTSGMDVTGLVRLFDVIAKDHRLLEVVVNAFTELLKGVLYRPPIFRIPATLRFTLVGLLTPSVSIYREAYSLWHNLMNVLGELNAYSVLVSWLGVFQKEQLRRILDSLKAFLSHEVAQKPGLYEEAKVRIVRAIEILWSASTRTRKLNFDEFYDNTINRVIDVSEEHKLWLDESGNWCYAKNAPWLLDAETKTLFLRLNSRDLMGRQQRHAMQNATQFCGNVPMVTPRDIFLCIVVERNALLRDTFQEIAQLKNPEMELKKPLRVAFKNEPGIDEGGVQREFFQLLVTELFDPEKEFFVPHKTFYWFNPQATDPSSKQAYFLTGILFGLAIYNGNLLDIRFPPAAYKQLKGVQMSISDLRDFDDDLYQGLQGILSYPGDVENDLRLTFEYMDFPLCQNGADIPVTNENREEYCELVASYVLTDSIRVQFGEFKTGFLEAAGTIVLDLFRPEEIALVVAGREELSFVDLESVTTYDRYQANSPAVRVFWNIVHSRLNDDEKRRLLYFTTACARAPINGLKSVPFRIGRDGDPSHIPTAHTCNFLLVLPDDPNEERMLKKLKIAIEHSEGFAFR